MSVHAKLIDKQTICKRFNETDIYNGNRSVNFTIVNNNEVNVLIPPTINKEKTKRFGYSLKSAADKILLALSLGQAPKNYSLEQNFDFENNPLTPIRDLSELNNDTLVSIKKGYPAVIVELDQPDERMLYSTIFSNSGAHAVTINMPLDNQATQDWCNESLKPSKPVDNANNYFLNSPQTIQFSSNGANEIYYSVSITKSREQEPAEPENPGNPLQGTKIDGDTFSYEIKADRGEFKKYKISVVGKNDSGKSEVQTFTYSIDRLPRKVGSVHIQPKSLTTYKGLRLSLITSCDNSTDIKYILRSSTEGHAAIDDPSDTELLDASNTVDNGIVKLQTSENTEKFFKIRLVGLNENNPEEFQYGPVSDIYRYQLTGEVINPGPVNVNPASGTFTQREKMEVESLRSDTIYYVDSLDGIDPQFPDDMFQVRDIDGPGPSSLVTRGIAGEKRTYKVRFKGYNSKYDEYGAESDVYSYTIDLRDSDNDPNPNPSPSNPDKEKCEQQGGIWIPFGNGFCIGGPEQKSTDYLTQNEAQNNPGYDETDRIYNQQSDILDPQKKFYLNNDAEELNIFDLVSQFIDEQINGNSSTSNEIEVSVDSQKVILGINGDGIGVQSHLVVDKIITTASNKNVLRVDDYGQIVITTQNLSISFRFVPGASDALCSSFQALGFECQNNKKSNALKFIYEDKDLEDPLQAVMRPAYVVSVNDTCEIGDVIVHGSEKYLTGLQICYDKNGTWQHLTPYIYDIDKFIQLADDKDVQANIDPYSGKYHLPKNTCNGPVSPAIYVFQ